MFGSHISKCISIFLWSRGWRVISHRLQSMANDSDDDGWYVHHSDHSHHSDGGDDKDCAVKSRFTYHGHLDSSSITKRTKRGGNSNTLCHDEALLGTSWWFDTIMLLLMMIQPIIVIIIIITQELPSTHITPSLVWEFESAGPKMAAFVYLPVSLGFSALKAGAAEGQGSFHHQWCLDLLLIASVFASDRFSICQTQPKWPQILRRQCKGVLKILTACRMLQISIARCQIGIFFTLFPKIFTGWWNINFFTNEWKVVNFLTDLWKKMLIFSLRSENLSSLLVLKMWFSPSSEKM